MRFSELSQEEVNELFHSVAHVAQSQIHDIKTTKYGRISSYDPENHTVKVILPQDRSEDDEAYETEPIPLGSLMIGNKFGVQYAPKGGASEEEPDKGELVAVTIVQRNTGLMKAAHLCYDETAEPPGSGKPDEDEEGGEESEEEENKEGWDDDPKGRIKLKGGEYLTRHESGSFSKFYENGDMQIYCTGNLYIYGKGDINVVVREGDLTATVEKGDLKVEVQEGDVTLDVWEGDLSATVELGDTLIDTPIGDTTVTSESGSIMLQTEAGDIMAQTDAGSVAVSGIDVQVIAAGILDLLAPIVNAGNPSMLQAVVKEVGALIYNEHTHPTPSGQSGPPDVPMTPGLATTVEFQAS